MYTTGSNRFLGTISEQRRHSRTAICGNRPTGRAVFTLDLQLADGKTRGTAAGFSRRSRVFHLPFLPLLLLLLLVLCSFFSRILFLLYTAVRRERLSRGKQSNGKTFRFSLTFRQTNASVYLYIVASRFNIFSRGRPRAEVKICKRFRGFDSVFSNRFTFEG